MSYTDRGSDTGMNNDSKENKDARWCATDFNPDGTVKLESTGEREFQVTIGVN